MTSDGRVVMLATASWDAITLWRLDVEAWIATAQVCLVPLPSKEAP